MTRLILREVTLVAVSSIALDATVEALQASRREAQFARTILFSDRRPDCLDDAGIEWVQIPPIRSKEDYSRFMLAKLVEHISTSHALCVQWDGYVVNGNAWDPDFLHYDYIGAVWPHFEDENNVGNGGFSLRSRGLLEATRELEFDGRLPEDVFIGRVARRKLEARGLKFAPAEVANRFAYERTRPTGDEFGFHGAFNLVELTSPLAAFRLFRSLEPEILTRGEHREILRWAFLRGRLRLAFAILLRLF